MSSVGLMATLSAAVLHAFWNLVLARSPDIRARTAVGMLVGTVVFLPVAVATPRIDPAAWPFLAASVALELGYFALLATAYERAPAGVVYPVARGSAPVLVLLVGALVLGEPVPALGVAGVLLVVAGIGLVRGLGGSAVRATHLLLALSVGACIAGYTLVDAAGVRRASPAAYIEVVYAAVAVVLTASAARTEGPDTLRRVLDLRTVAAGVGIVAAYGLVLVALSLGPAAPVAAVRETSVLIALLLLSVTGRERARPAQLAGAVAVCAGVACVVLG